tara:strand:- start:356 stop:628 length:273 start_codon:yes stop_codon:yes gene_type:complete
MTNFTNENNDSPLKTIFEAATLNFGAVIGFIEDGGYLLLAIKRDHPVFEDAPYMTIKGYISPNDNTTPVFIWGHYDLGREAALSEIRSAK